MSVLLFIFTFIVSLLFAFSSIYCWHIGHIVLAILSFIAMFMIWGVAHVITQLSHTPAKPSPTTRTISKTGKDE